MYVFLIPFDNETVIMSLTFEFHVLCFHLPIFQLKWRSSSLRKLIIVGVNYVWVLFVVAINLFWAVIFRNFRITIMYIIVAKVTNIVATSNIYALKKGPKVRLTNPTQTHAEAHTISNIFHLPHNTIMQICPEFRSFVLYTLMNWACVTMAI